MLSVHWIKLTTGGWCPLQTVDLSGVTASGVYVIWHRGTPELTVRVGKGDIAALKPRAHRTDPDVQAYAHYGLSVTWASVPAYQQSGVERYLADLLQPLVGERFPGVHPLPVNSPFAA